MGGWLVVDDTQAVGILGNFPGRRNPYGAGGGGSFRYHGINSPNVWTISSLAKAFGTPLTVVGASAENIGMFEEHSMTTVHCSPPSAALLHAAEYAVRRNRLAGDHLRNRLLRAVLRFRKEMGEAGLELRGGILPKQTLAPRHSRLAFELHDKLLATDVRAVLHRERRDEPAALSFLVTAEHSMDQIVKTRIVMEALLHQGKRSRNELQRKKEDQTDESGIAI